MLQDGFLQTPFSLAEARVLYELSRREKVTATEIAAELGLDHGYLSRILRGFGERGLVVKTASPNDRRQGLLSLTTKGRMAFAPLDQGSQKEVAGMIGRLSATDQERVVAAMRTIESLLAETSPADVPYILRPPRSGDMGWIVSRHGALYGEEYGWDERLEALFAEIVATFVRNFDAKRERCWIAERDGENVGFGLLRRIPRRPRGCACCWSSRRRAGSASARGWWRSASASRAKRATRRSRSGLTACSSPRGTSTSRRASS